MPRITISYRREDSGVITGRIFDRLVARYGRDAIFRDIDDIPYGVDFRAHIDQVLGSTDVLVAVVGPNWAGPSASQSRLSNEADPVRVEIETALRKKVPLIPVLVLGAIMPTVTQLPEALRDFAYRNAVQLDAGQDFDVHMARLLRAVDGVLGLAAEAARPLRDETAPPRSRPPAAKRHGIVIASAVGVVLASALIVGWLFGLNRLMFSLPRDTGSVATNTASPSASTPLTRPAVPASKNAGPTEAESLLWKLVKDSNNPGEFEQYLREYPDGHFAEAAHARLASLHPTALMPSPDQETIFWQSISNSKIAADFEEYLRKYPQGQFAGLARNKLSTLAPALPTIVAPKLAPPSPEISMALSRGAQAIKARNYQAAKRWYQKAADLGSAEGQYNLGLLWGFYYHEEGINNALPIDESQEKQWIAKAAAQGYPAAEYRMGERYRLAGPEQNEVEAFRWYRKAAEHGDVDAQFELGQRYTFGPGVTVDPREGLKWYRAAANAGNAGAQTRVGLAYADGKIVAQDYREAAKWYGMACEGGDDAACLNVGTMYAEGRGVAVDLNTARAYMRKASASGGGPIQLMARDWLAKH